MKKRRERFETEVEEIQRALLQIGVSRQVRAADGLRDEPRHGDLDRDERRMTVRVS